MNLEGWTCMDGAMVLAMCVVLMVRRLCMEVPTCQNRVRRWTTRIPTQMSFMAVQSLSLTSCACALAMGLRWPSTDDAMSALWNGTECDPCHDVMPSQVCNTIFHFSVISLFSNVAGSRYAVVRYMLAMFYPFSSSYACLLYLVTSMSTFQLVCFVVCTLYL